MALGPAGWLVHSAKLKEPRYHLSLRGVRTLVTRFSMRLWGTLATNYDAILFASPFYLFDVMLIVGVGVYEIQRKCMSAKARGVASVASVFSGPRAQCMSSVQVFILFSVIHGMVVS